MQTVTVAVCVDNPEVVPEEMADLICNYLNQAGVRGETPTTVCIVSQSKTDKQGECQ